MKLLSHILKQAIQAGIAMAIVAILFLFIGFEVLSLGLPILYNVVIMLLTLLVFIFLGIVTAFAYFEYKKEFNK